MQPLSNQDLVLLSAYLDGELSEAEHQTLEKRLTNEPDLLAELESLQEVVQLANSLPRLKAPHDFRLDPAIYSRSIKSQPRITKIGSLGRTQLSRLVGLAAVLILVSGFLLVNNPFSSDETTSSLQNDRAEVAQLALTNTAEAEAADTSVIDNTSEQTVIAILPTATLEMNTADGQSDLDVPSPSTNRAFPTPTPLATSIDNEIAVDEGADSGNELDDSVPDDSATLESLAMDDMGGDTAADALPPTPPSANAGGSGGGPTNTEPSLKTDEPTEQQATVEVLSFDDTYDVTDADSNADNGEETETMEEDYAESPQASAAETGLADEDGTASHDANPSAPPGEGASDDIDVFGTGIFREDIVRRLITLVNMLINFVFP